MRTPTPIYLTVLRQGDVHRVDLAEVGSLIPRSETRVEATFLAQLAQEMQRLGAPARSGDAGRVRELQRLGALVYSHLLTESAQRRLREAPTCDLYLRLDEQLLAVPWELCHDGTAFLATKFRVGRQVITSRPIRVVDAAIRPPGAALRVLLVADPTETLPEASREAERLCELLDGIDGLDVTLVGGRSVRKIPLLGALQEHDVVHFAGHSFYDPDEPGRSGWRLADSVLTADELGRLLTPPALVFSNSCEAGASPGWPPGGRYDRDAYGIGSACLLAGVKSFVGTFWVVHDDESVQFAISCYQALASGESLGAALLHAREVIREERGADALAWASYVLYGDPTFVPFPTAGRGGGSTPTLRRDAPPHPGSARYDVQVRRGEASEARIGVVAPPTTPVVGRSSVLARLDAALEAGRGGQRQVVFVAGPPGIGKTTVVDSFLARAAESGDLWIAQGQSVEQYGAGEAYLPVLEAWSRMCRDASGASLTRHLRRHAPSWLAQLPSVFGDDAAVTGEAPAPATTRERMLREMAELVEAVSAERPVVLALEDLHWSDPSTLDLVSYLAERREPARLVVLGTFRPEETMDGEHPLRAIVQRLRSRSRCEEIRLDALTEPAVAEYLAGRFPTSSVAPSLARLVHQRTEGHPLFVVNVVDFMLREGFMTERDGRLVLREGLATLPSGVPESLRRMIEQQIEGLDEAERRIVEAASVAGAEFAVAAVAAVTADDVDAIEERCEGLAWRGRLLRSQGIEEWPDGTVSGRYRFLHALYQDVLYARMAEMRRARAHRRILERKEAAFGERAAEIAGELASHAEAARDWRRAVTHHTRAGDNAIARHAAHEAVDHLSRAVALLPQLPEGSDRNRLELSLLVKLATPLMSTRGYGAREVEQVFDRAHALSRGLPRGPHLFPLLRGLVSFHHVRGHNVTARAIGEELLALCEGSDDRFALVQAHYGHGAVLYDLVEIEAGKRHLERALALYDPAQHATHVSVYGGYDPGVGCRCWLAWTLWLQGFPDRALQMGNEAVALAQELGHPFSLSFAHLATSFVRLYRGEVDEGSAHVEAAEEIARREGFAFQDAIAATTHGWSALLRGRAEEAIARLDDALERYGATGAGVARPGILNLLAFAKALSGRIDEALALIEEALAEAEQTEQRLHLVELRRTKAELLLWAGRDRRDVERLLVSALDLARTLGVRSSELRTATRLARLLQQEGRVEEARHVLAPVVGWFSEGFASRDLREASELLAQL